MKAKKRFIIMGIVPVGVLLFFLYQVFSGTAFLYRSEEKIKEKLLNKTPVGTSLNEVENFLEETNFSIRSYWERGSKSHLTVDLGTYQGIPWEVAVVTRWNFENGFLTEILVHKEYDAL